MDQRQKKSLRRRLLSIYIGYFIVLLAGFVYSFLPNFTSGFTRGLELATLASEDASMSTYILPATLDNTVHQPQIPLKSNREGIDVQVEASDVIILVKASGQTDPALTGELSLLSYSLWFAFPILLAKLAILILLALIINILRVSVRGGQVLPRRIVSYTRAIALILVLVTLLDSTSSWVFHHVAAIVLDGSGLKVASSIGIDYWAIFMAILIFFSAEVFSIGSKLGEEQKLTI